MKKLLRYLSVFACTTISIQTLAIAGAVDGGGGKGVVCRDQGGQITSAEVLDLYEGLVMYGINVQKSNDPMDTQIQSAISKIPLLNRGLVKFYVDQVLKYKRIMPPGTVLIPINDSFEVVLPGGCKAEQLANYYNDKLILISGDIWNQLGETDKAALILHEAVYAMNRLVGATESRQSRHIVANLFSPDTKWEDIKADVPQAALNCAGEGMFMWAFKSNDQSNWIMQFQILGKAYVMSKKTLQVDANDFDFNEAKNFPILPGEDLIGTGITTYPSVESNYQPNDLISISKKWEAIKDTNGQIIRGYQTPRYYLSWKSGTHPGPSVDDKMINCSIEM